MVLQKLFTRYFTVQEARQLLPFVKQTLEQAHAELDALKDEVILYKRIYQLREEEGGQPQDPQVAAMVDVLHHKWQAYEACFHRWVNLLVEKGIQVRDFKKGLIDFPYRAQDGTEYFLCWHLGEEGLLHFHDLFEGYNGRKPISLLPE